MKVIEAGKRRLRGDAKREANSEEMKHSEVKMKG